MHNQSEKDGEREVYGTERVETATVTGHIHKWVENARDKSEGVPWQCVPATCQMTQRSATSVESQRMSLGQCVRQYSLRR